MMHYRQLRLAILPAFVFLSSACGSSGSQSESADGSADSVPMAVSASPQPAGAATTKDLSKVEPVVRPGAERPLDSAPDRISKHAGKRLFATGFEDGVSLQRDGNSPYQQLVGNDGSGYSFPIGLSGAPVPGP
ncbi:MAG: hypothetical protein H0T52_07735, partial [Lautropia sp.]|nr:hypothetical protein [Lautropia sp.]